MQHAILLALAVLARLAAGDAPIPLWNGADLAGWRIIGVGDWRIVDGAIRGTHAKEQKDYGHLVTDAEYADFTLACSFKAVKGNSGLYFRVEEKGSSGISGFQAEVDATRDVGGLYETNGRGWVVKPTKEQLAAFFKPQEWNAMTVEARGTRLRVTVNGTVTADIDDPKGRRSGRIALQVHGGQDCEVWFKDLTIAPAQAAASP